MQLMIPPSVILQPQKIHYSSTSSSRSRSSAV